jgi:hypothetical protein
VSNEGRKKDEPELITRVRFEEGGAGINPKPKQPLPSNPPKGNPGEESKSGTDLE